MQPLSRFEKVFFGMLAALPLSALGAALFGDGAVSRVGAGALALGAIGLLGAQAHAGLTLAARRRAEVEQLRSEIERLPAQAKLG